MLAFPEQQLTDEDLVRVTDYFGSVGDDPYFVPINNTVVALTAGQIEALVFAEIGTRTGQKTPTHWHLFIQLSRASCWGNTGFANQQLALHRCPTSCASDLRTRLLYIPQPLPMVPKEPG